jgi:probable phosphoglycerate mutase
MKIIVTRHGETEWNRVGRIQGWAPTSLNESGRRQTNQLAEHLAKNYDVRKIYSSDLRRAAETTEVILDQLQHSPENIEYLRDLRERNVGVYQGLSKKRRSEFKEYFLPQGGSQAVATVPENGESISQFSDRVVSAWKHDISYRDVTRSESDCENVLLVVTHGGPIRMILGYLNGSDLVRTYDTDPHNNCSISEFIRKGPDEYEIGSLDSVAYRQA